MSRLDKALKGPTAIDSADRIAASHEGVQPSALSEARRLKRDGGDWGAVLSTNSHTRAIILAQKIRGAIASAR